MHRKISDEEKRLRSINTYVVLFVFFIMVSAVICMYISRSKWKRGFLPSSLLITT
jgi:hypothetical protein